MKKEIIKVCSSNINVLYDYYILVSGELLGEVILSLEVDSDYKMNLLDVPNITKYMGITGIKVAGIFKENRPEILMNDKYLNYF